MTEITLSDDLSDRIEKRVEHTEFENVDDYVEFVLSEVLTHVERDSEGVSEPTASREEVETRLQSLGYLDD